MAEFMVMLKGSMKEWNDLPAEESQRILKKYGEWVEKLRSENRFKGGSPLQDGFWQLKANGPEISVDGPFTETKETLTGYFIIEAEDSKQALELAKECPALGHGESVELYTLGH